MRNFLKTCVLLVLAATTSTACAHFRVAPDTLSASTFEQRRRVHTIAWGALEPRIAPPNCNGAGLASVTVRITFVDFLITAGTLGFMSPVTVLWSCAKQPGAAR